ncbi:MAG: PAS domain S-box protein [Methylococcus sp.]
MAACGLDELAITVIGHSLMPWCVLNEQGLVLAINRSARNALRLSGENQTGLNLLARMGLDSSRLDELSQEGTGQGLRTISVVWPLDDGESLPITCGILTNAEAGTWKWLLTIDPAEALSNGVCDIEGHFRAIVDTITDGVIVIDQKGIVQLINPAVEQMFGYTRQELIGTNINILMPSPDRERHDEYLQRYYREGVARMIGKGREVMARRKDGSRLPVLLSVGVLGQDARRFVGIVHDLSHRRRAEERVALLSSAVEQAPAGILIADLNGNIEYVNEGFSHLTGYRAEEVEGHNLFVPGSVMTSISSNAPLCWRLLSTRDWQGEIKDHNKNGKPYWALVTFSAIQDKRGIPIRLLGRFQDITRQKIDQEALSKSEERFSEVARMVGEWLWEQDASGHYTYCSDAVEDILGYKPEEVLGKHYQTLLTDADRKLWFERLPQFERVNRPFHKLINHYRHRDGHEVFTESSGTPLINEQGETIRWRGVDLDITERKRVEDAVRLRERAIEAASVGIAIADARQPNFPNIYINSALCRITGYEEHELLGRSLRLLQGKGTDENAREVIRRALATGQRCEVIIRNYRKDGTGFWNELMLSPVQDEQGELTHYIGIIADVSERRRAEDERHELEIARQIQMSLLPSLPLTLTDMAVAGVCIPAAQVGGDYYDYICHGGYVDLVVADVSGHSVGAALIMAEMRSTLKAELRRNDIQPESTAQLLSALNEMLFDDLNGADLFITMFYLRYDRSTRRLRYASAGHNPPLLLKHSATCCVGLDADGMILGVSPNVTFEEKELILEPGDRLLLYTDGATETQNELGKFFGAQRLCRAFTGQRGFPPEVALENILDQLRDFRKSGAFLDDITLVSMSLN